ncbi:MAG: hypothetical protein ACI9MR_005237 [Myxococcota bacterium]|jgi:hypothetical protein
MGRLRKQIEDAGYPTWSETYPSRAQPIDVLAHELAENIRTNVPEGPLLAVTHSMGGILVRFMSGLLPWQRVVMLAPPNAGSIVALRMSLNPLFRWWFGPAGQELGDDTLWPAPPQPFGVIAGTLGPSIGNVPSWVVGSILPKDEDNDGTLTVSETKCDGMADFAAVRASHTWIMDHEETAPNVLGFFADGRFPQPSSLATAP